MSAWCLTSPTRVIVGASTAPMPAASSLEHSHAKVARCRSREPSRVLVSPATGGSRTTFSCGPAMPATAQPERLVRARVVSADAHGVHAAIQSAAGSAARLPSILQKTATSTGTPPCGRPPHPRSPQSGRVAGVRRDRQQVSGSSSPRSTRSTRSCSSSGVIRVMASPAFSIPRGHCSHHPTCFVGPGHQHAQWSTRHRYDRPSRAARRAPVCCAATSGRWRTPARPPEIVIGSAPLGPCQQNGAGSDTGAEETPTTADGAIASETHRAKLCGERAPASVGLSDVGCRQPARTPGTLTSRRSMTVGPIRGSVACVAAPREPG